MYSFYDMSELRIFQHRLKYCFKYNTFMEKSVNEKQKTPIRGYDGCLKKIKKKKKSSQYVSISSCPIFGCFYASLQCIIGYFSMSVQCLFLFSSEKRVILNEEFGGGGGEIFILPQLQEKFRLINLGKSTFGSY